MIATYFIMHVNILICYTTGMDSLQNILGTRKFDEPPEIETIKTFVRKTFSMDVTVNVGPHTITIITPSAGLAGSLRPLIHKLKKELDTDKKVFIRIVGVK